MKDTCGKNHSKVLYTIACAFLFMAFYTSTKFKK